MNSKDKCQWIYQNRFKIKHIIINNYNESLYQKIISLAQNENTEAVELSKKLLNNLPDSEYNLSDGSDIWLNYIKVLWKE